MKTFCLLLSFALSACIARAQSQPDTSFHQTTASGKVYLFDSQGMQIYQQAFDSIYDRNELGYYKAVGEEGRFFIHPAKKWILKYPAEMDSLMPFSYAYASESTFSNTPLIHFNQSYLIYMMEDGKVVTNCKNIKKQRGSYVFALCEYYESETAAENPVMPYLSNWLYHQSFSSIQLVEGRSQKRTEELYIVKQNGKYGVVSSLGFYVIEPKYKKIKPYYQDYHSLPHFQVKNKRWAIFDCKGNQLTPFDYKDFNAEYDEHRNLYSISAHVPIKGFFPVENKKVGFLDEKGKLVVPLEYQLIRTLSFKDFGWQTIYPDQFPAVDPASKVYPYDYYVIGQTGNAYTFYAPNGQKLATHQIEQFNESNPNGYFSFTHSDSMSVLVDPNAQKIVEVNGWISMYRGNKNFFIVVTPKGEDDYDIMLCNENMKRLYEGEFRRTGFIEGTKYMITQYNGQEAVMDVERSGEEIVWTIPPSNAMITSEQTDELIQGWKYFTENGKVGIMTIEGEVILPAIYKSITWVSKDYLAVDNGTKSAVFDLDFKPVSDFIYDSIAISPTYENGLLIVQKNGKWDLWNVKLDVYVTDFKYDEIRYSTVNFGNSFIVAKEGKYGIIYADGRILMPIQYAKITSDDGRHGIYGTCTTFDGKIVYLDTYGRNSPWLAPKSIKQ